MTRALDRATDPRVTPLFIADHPELVGVSGASWAGRGEVWLAPERTGKLVRLSIGPDGLGPPRAIPILGLPNETDVESISVVDDGRLLLGTEARGKRRTDPLFFARATETEVRIERPLVFDYAAFGRVAEDNQGIEGACVALGKAVAASEAVETRDGRRYALVGVFDLATGAMVPHRVELGSQKGKISALACRPSVTRAQIEAQAIERHFGTMRLVQFALPVEGPSVDVRADLVLDLVPFLGPSPPNLEGLTWIEERALLAVSDNHYGKKTGPPRAFRLAPGKLSTR